MTHDTHGEYLWPAPFTTLLVSPALVARNGNETFTAIIQEEAAKPTKISASKDLRRTRWFALGLSASLFV